MAEDDEADVLLGVGRRCSGGCHERQADVEGGGGGDDALGIGMGCALFWALEAEG